jgi:nitroimidazol reductase NimA-like FMN-containing flavoprotein (pyridoxamine 5'-phosphate oxidase superfamily)
MFRPMRRKKQLLSMEATEEILYRGQNGVLAVIGDDDYPYAVPLSYVYEKGKLYFHCAKDGHKIDGLSRNDKVSFAVVDEDQIVPEKFTTYFRSVILFGKARVVSEESLKRHALGLLVRKYSSGFEREGEDEINKDIKTVCVVEITIENISGKEAIEFVKVK